MTTQKPSVGSKVRAAQAKMGSAPRAPAVPAPCGGRVGAATAVQPKALHQGARSSLAARGGVVQRASIENTGYTVIIAGYFSTTHLASSQNSAELKSEARAIQAGRGLTNTVIDSTNQGVKNLVKAADYSNDTYLINGNQYGVKINVSYWQVEMAARVAREDDEGDFVYVVRRTDRVNICISVGRPPLRRAIPAPGWAHMDALRSM